jgi:hypothetical protein
VPELTYGKNADIPAASAALRLCYSPQKGRYMEATRDIKIGQFLLTQDTSLFLRLLVVRNVGT